MIPIPNFSALIAQVTFSQPLMTVISIFPAFINSFLETFITSGQDQVPKPMQNVLVAVGVFSKYQFLFSCFSLKTVEVDCNNLLQIIEN